MGNLSKMHRENRFSKPKMGAKAYPLRKIVGKGLDDDGIPCEILECGHKIVPPSDFIGTTNAIRRRCYKCAKAEGKS